MKISKVEIQNFRNFKEKNIIKCSTDGKVTIIYGENGDGKTTLHQFFQWVFYNRVRFNKTASDKMYNLEFEREQDYGAIFSVIGMIDFEHDGEYYSIRREWSYKKGLDDSKKIGEEVTLNKKDNDNNWNRLKNPEEVIETLLPSGLSEYFFFDGENMIADLSVKGKDSAKKLRKALYSIFNLDVLENAIAHIGAKDYKTSVIGQLFLSKTSETNQSDINVLLTNINNAQDKITKTNDALETVIKELDEKNAFVREASEKIGGTKSKAEYENERNRLKKQRDNYLQITKDMQASFGAEVVETFPNMLISKILPKAKNVVSLKVDKTEITPGLTKELILNLLKANECICGRTLDDKERSTLSAYLEKFPPYSYSEMYNILSNKAEAWGKKYNREKLDNHISNTLNYLQHAEECDAEIKALDEEEKNGDSDIQQLIIDRGAAESRIEDLLEEKAKLDGDLSLLTRYLKQQNKKFEQETSNSDINNAIDYRIDVMNEVKKHFEEKLKSVSVDYSEKLQQTIQELLDEILNSKRTVSVSPDFFVRVFDSYNDESKSEGQFAVVSFAYIGGILKLLQGEEALKSKEYPLILDGPFSKLGPDHKQNVIDTIPKFAPQLIIFSKDDLQDNFDPEELGYVWTIKSNAEKNVAKVEEGFLW